MSVKSIVGMQTDAQQDMFRLYSKGINFSVTNNIDQEKSLTTFNARTETPLMNMVMGKRNDDAFKKIAYEFKKDFASVVSA